MTEAGIAGYRTNREFLAAELEWLDHALRFLVHAFHRNEGDTKGQGWFLSRKQVEGWLTDSHREESPEMAGMRGSLHQRWADHLARKTAALEQGIDLPLARLAQLFRLSPIEETAVVACLAPELDSKYAKVYSYLEDDLTRRLPSIDLILKLSRLRIGADASESLLFSTHAPIFRWQLVTAATERDIVSHRRTQGLVLDARVLAFLTGAPQIDSRIVPFLRKGRIEQDFSSSGIAEKLNAFVKSKKRKLVVYFYGPASSEGERLAQETCCDLDVGLLRFDIGELLDGTLSSGLSFSDALTRLFREALLQPAAVYLSGFEKVLGDPRSATCLHALEELLREASWLTFLEGQRLWMMPAISEDLAFVPFSLPIPGYESRREKWTALLDGGPGSIRPEDLQTIAARYRFTFGEMQQTLRLAHCQSDLRPPEESALKVDDLVWACRIRSHASFGGLARSIEPRATWNELVLPEPVLQQLREICAQVRKRAIVFHHWGFDRRLSMGKGLYALFAGPSGAGKTLAAEVVAGSLGLDLLKVDLSATVSKYIGETEKNLQRIFEAAERSDAILFFDEADALFGKRSEVKDAHDRYANIEINFLLQRLEEFEGVVILATNLAQNLDEAFSRRIHLTVEFPFPNEVLRLAIWKSHFPSETPVADDLDLPYLAKQFKIPGGNIRNIVLNAAFLAADDGGSVQMSHLLQAARREYEKMGKHYQEETA